MLSRCTLLARSAFEAISATLGPAVDVTWRHRCVHAARLLPAVTLERNVSTGVSSSCCTSLHCRVHPEMACLLLYDQSRECPAQYWNSCSRGPAMWAQVLFHDLSHRSHHSLILTQIFPFPDSGQFSKGDPPGHHYRSRARWWSIRSHYLRGRYPRQGGRQCRSVSTAPRGCRGRWC